jgi:hypothetical protein
MQMIFLIFPFNIFYIKTSNMKRILFHQPLLFFYSLIITFAFAACQKQTSDPVSSAISEEMATAKTGSKPGTVQEVLVKVTVNDVGNKVNSDGGGDYVNGSQAVSARIDQYGNLIFSCGTSGRGPTATQVRWLNYDFSDPLPGYSARASERGAYIATIKSSVASSTFIPLQNLEVGTTECMTMAMGLYTLTEGVVNFHRQPTEDNSTTPTAYVYATRNSETQWTMTPVPPLSGGCSTISNVAALRVSTELVGYYNMPFNLTLTKL